MARIALIASSPPSALYPCSLRCPRAVRSLAISVAHHYHLWAEAEAEAVAAEVAGAAAAATELLLRQLQIMIKKALPLACAGQRERFLV